MPNWPRRNLTNCKRRCFMRKRTLQYIHVRLLGNPSGRSSALDQATETARQFVPHRTRPCADHAHACRSRIHYFKLWNTLPASWIFRTSHAQRSALAQYFILMQKLLVLVSVVCLHTKTETVYLCLEASMHARRQTVKCVEKHPQRWFAHPSSSPL